MGRGEAKPQGVERVRRFKVCMMCLQNLIKRKALAHVKVKGIAHLSDVHTKSHSKQKFIESRDMTASSEGGPSDVKENTVGRVKKVGLCVERNAGALCSAGGVVAMRASTPDEADTTSAFSVACLRRA